MNQLPTKYVNVKTVVVSSELKEATDTLEGIIKAVVSNLRHQPTYSIGIPETLNPLSKTFIDGHFMIGFHCGFLPMPIDIYIMVNMRDVGYARDFTIRNLEFRYRQTLAEYL